MEKALKSSSDNHLSGSCVASMQAQPWSDDQLKRQQSLQAAFAFFNETSQQLERSYKALEQKVHILNHELQRVEQARDLESKKHNELEQRMSALLDFLPGGVIVLNARGVVIESNPAAKRLLAVDLQGRVWRHIIAECFAPKNDDGFEVSTKQGLRLSLATSSLGQEGQIILLTDQTETRRLQEGLSRNERLSAMGKMVSALAHQIRTPLSAAVLYAGHLCQPDLDRCMQEKFAQKCLSRLQHMEKQVRDMMLFVKSELPLNDCINGNTLEHELRAAAEVAIHSSGALCTWENTAQDVSIKCHKEAFVSSLMNLINNALQSSETQIHLRIILQEKNKDGRHYLSISIMDNGNGMDAALLEKINESFVTTKAQGTGLGLSVVRSIAKAHGADFSLTSKQQQGTTASITVPVVNT